MSNREAQARELAHHEAVYSGFAQRHFAKPAVRAFRAHLAGRILARTGATRGARVLSLGCGIGDTELLLSPHVGRLTGIDLSPAAIRQATSDAAARGVANIEFLVGDMESAALEPESFDLVIAVFFLHHLSSNELDAMPAHVARVLAPGGVFYSLDPSRYRLAGAIGKVVVPRLMAQHQSPDERELDRGETRVRFEQAGLAVTASMYDFLSTPVAGLFPGSAWLYRATRLADEILTRAPLLGRLGSNFELAAKKKP
jgi:SAM-dependent methyltransferase